MHCATFSGPKQCFTISVFAPIFNSDRFSHNLSLDQKLAVLGTNSCTAINTPGRSSFWTLFLRRNDVVQTWTNSKFANKTPETTVNTPRKTQNICIGDYFVILKIMVFREKITQKWSGVSPFVTDFFRPTVKAPPRSRRPVARKTQ